jgi:glucose-1-phosphate thymidylyltransferase
MSEPLKVVILTAGLGTRLRPQTWSKPKPLVGVAGQTALDHLLGAFKTLPAALDVEYVVVIGPHLGEDQIPAFMQEHYPDLKTRFVVQRVMRGQSDAIYQARQYLDGRTVVCFSDTLIDTDFSFLAGETAGGVAWIKHVPDPRRFGVVEVGKDGWVTHLIEKPESLDNDCVVVGCYYLREGQDLVAAIEEQMKRGTSLRGEYFLVDALNILLERGLKMRTQTVEVWLDTGTIEATLETNRYLLEHGRANRTQAEKRGSAEIVPPVFIHETAVISDSVIGPYASIGPDCRITHARVEDSILEAGVTVEAAALKGSFIGRHSRVQGRAPGTLPLQLNVGDNSSVIIK